MKFDVHGFDKRLEKLKKDLEKPSKKSDWSTIPKENRAKLLEFYDHLVGRGVSAGRVIKYMYFLKTITKILGKRYEDADRKDIEHLLATLRSSKNKNTGNPYTPNTMKDFKVITKIFYRWLRGYPNNNDPPEVAWYTCTLRSNEIVIREILKHSEVVKLIDSIPDVKFRAFFAVMYETAMRPEECLSLVWNDVQDMEKGKMLVCHGKTGARVLYSFWSAKYLIGYLNTHPNMFRDKIDPNMPLWIGRDTGKEILPLSYSTINQYFHKIFEKSGIALKSEPSLYILRRTRLTELLKIFPEGLVKLIAGHTKSSNTLGKYYNALTSTDVYDALAAHYGIKVKRTIEKEMVDLTKCPICNAQVTPDQSYCITCMTPLKQEYAERRKQLEKQYVEFMADPKNKEIILQVIEFMQKKGKKIVKR